MNFLNYEAFILSGMKKKPVSVTASIAGDDKNRNENSLKGFERPFAKIEDSLSEKIRTASTVHDLVDVLNEIKEADLGEKAYEITSKQILKYSDSRKKRSAKQFNIAKKKGGYRTITSPGKTHKNILRYVNVIFNSLYNPMPCVNGFTEGRSVVANACCHIGQNYIFNIDLKDFFNSFTEGRIFKVLQLKPYCLNRNVASVLAGLCSMRVEGYESPVLPQGSPTSPTLTNMLCHQLDRRLSGLAKRFRLRYTRYADDITFSSNHNVYHENGEFRMELSRIIESQGLRINPNKTRLQKKYKHSQEVTGLIISEKVNVSRKYISDLRFILHLWDKFGYEAAFERFYNMYKSEKGHVKGEPTLENVISGKLEYLKMVKGSKDSTYVSLLNIFLRLTSLPIESNKFPLDKYQYIISYPVSDFEPLYKTKIEIDSVNSGYVKSFFKQNDRQIPVFVSRYLRNMYIPSLDMLLKISLDIRDKVKKKLISAEDGRLEFRTKANAFYESVNASCKFFYESFDEIKESCFITLCSKSGKASWLLTEKKPKFVLSDIKGLTIDYFLDVWEEKGLDAAARIYNGSFPPSTLETDKILQMWEECGIDAAAKAFDNPNYILDNEG